jgi:uncharacterized protein
MLTTLLQSENVPSLILDPDDRNRLHNHAMVEAVAKAGNTRVVEIHMQTDHSYSDHRIALQAALLNWLLATFKPPSK